MEFIENFVRIQWEFSDNSNLVSIWHESQIDTTFSPHSHRNITGLTFNIPLESSENALRIQWAFLENILITHWEFNAHLLWMWWELHDNSMIIQIWLEFDIRAKFTPQFRHILIYLSPDSHATFRDNSVRKHGGISDDSVRNYFEDLLRI